MKKLRVKKDLPIYITIVERTKGKYNDIAGCWLKDHLFYCDSTTPNSLRKVWELYKDGTIINCDNFKEQIKIDISQFTGHLVGERETKQLLRLIYLHTQKFYK